MTFDDPEKGMTEVKLATRDTPDQLKRALADDKARREERANAAAGAAAGDERKGGLFGWLKR